MEIKLKENPLETALVGKMTTKLDSKVAFFGMTDELSCYLMKIRCLIDSENVKEELLVIVKTLSSIMAQVAGGKFKLSMEDLDWILNLVKKYEYNNGKLTEFVIPGQNIVSAEIHIARCLARKTELAYAKVYYDYNESEIIFEYLNKLSSLLFALALKYE